MFTDYNVNVELNSSSLVTEEVDSGGLFSSGISFSRFTSLVTLGVGLPVDTPDWFTNLFMMWQIAFLIITIGWFISSIWNG